jgi:hypothetical protein
MHHPPSDYPASGTVTELLRISFCVRRQHVGKR